MLTKLQIYDGSMISLLGALAFLTCVAGTMRAYRLWRTRGFHLKDFKKLSRDARELNMETDKVNSDICRDNAENGTNFANIEVLAVASEWDTGVRIALDTWEDVMHTTEGASDVEAGRMDKTLKERRNSHRRYIIGLMRSRCIECIVKRRELSPQLQRVQLEATFRNANRELNTTAGRTLGQDICDKSNIIASTNLSDIELDRGESERSRSGINSQETERERNIIHEKYRYVSPTAKLVLSVSLAPDALLAVPLRASMYPAAGVKERELDSSQRDIFEEAD